MTGAAAVLLLMLLGVSGLLAPPAHAAPATALYVSPGGLDSGNCPSARPCATVSYALTKAAAGATIRISGTVDDHLTITRRVRLTTWRGGPAHSAGVLDGTRTPNEAVITVSPGVADVTVDNLTIRNGVLGIEDVQSTINLDDATVSGNHNGGEPYAGIWNDFGTMNIIDSTIANNTNYGSTVGAGIDNIGTMTIVDSTITGNTGGGIYSGQNHVVRLAATIVAENTRGANCSGYDPASLQSGGYNLTSDRTGHACDFRQATDRVNKNPRLGKLARNGGPTSTLLPAAGGPADDAIPAGTNLAGVAVCHRRDQRGAVRPAAHDTHCTIGSVEV